MLMEISDIIENISCNCIKVQRKTFEKGSIITTYIEKRKQICIRICSEYRIKRRGCY